MRITVALGCALLAFQPSAPAHQLVSRGWTEQGVAIGEAGFADGGPIPAGSKVELLDVAGERIGEVAAGAHGRFCHIQGPVPAVAFRVDLGAGHVFRGTFTREHDNDHDHDHDHHDSAELVSLRQAVTELQSQRRLRDVLGGLGYIAGLFGLGFYLLARRERARP